MTSRARAEAARNQAYTLTRKRFRMMPTTLHVEERDGDWRVVVSLPHFPTVPIEEVDISGVKVDFRVTGPVGLL